MSLIKKEDKQNRRRGNDLESKRVSAYSYHNVRSEEEETTGRDPARSVIQENKLSKLLNRVGAAVFLIVCIICLVSILSLSPAPRIVLVGSEDGNMLFNEYRQSLGTVSQKLFASSILNRNKITVNSNGIAAELTKVFPEFSQITISMPLIGQHPIIYVTQTVPSLTLTNPSGRYLINNNGVAVLYSQGNSQFNNLKLPNLEEESSFDVRVGHAALTSNNVDFIETVDYQLSAKGYKISSYDLLAGTNELDVHLSTEPYYIRFNLENNNATTQVGRFLATAHYFKQNNINPSSYVDVRTDGRVYYK